MLNQIPIVIAGGGIVKYGESFFESAEDIEVKITDETKEISTITRGKVVERLVSRKAEISFKPVKFSDFSAIYGVLSKNRGELVFGTVNTPCEIYGADGTHFVFPRSAIPNPGALGLGIDKDPFETITIQALPDPSKPLSDVSSLYVRSSAAMPALPALQNADLAASAFIAVYGDPENGGFAFDLEEGGTFNFEIETAEKKIDRLGIYDYQVKEIGVSFTCKPANISYENWEKLTNMASSPRLGGVYEGGKGLVVRGTFSGDIVCSVASVICKERGLTWSDEASRMSEITLNAVGDNKFKMSTASDDYSFGESE